MALGRGNVKASEAGAKASMQRCFTAAGAPFVP